MVSKYKKAGKQEQCSCNYRLCHYTGCNYRQNSFYSFISLINVFSIITASKLTQTLSLIFLNLFNYFAPASLFDMFLGTVDLSTMEITKLDDAIAVSREAGVMTGEGRRLLVAAMSLRKIRSALLSGPNWNVVQVELEHMQEDAKDFELTYAIEEKRKTENEFKNKKEQEEKTKDNYKTTFRQQKRERLALLKQTRNNNTSNTNTNQADELSAPPPHVLIANEIDSIVFEMNLHFNMIEVLRDLQIGSSTYNLDILTTTLKKSKVLNMSTSTNLNVVTQIYRAEKLRDTLAGAHSRLKEALDQFNGNVTLTELEEDNATSRSISYNSYQHKNNQIVLAESKSGTSYRGRSVVERVVHNKTSIVNVRISRPNQLRQAYLYAERVHYHTSPLGLEVS